MKKLFRRLKNYLDQLRPSDEKCSRFFQKVIKVEEPKEFWSVLEEFSDIFRRFVEDSTICQSCVKSSEILLRYEEANVYSRRILEGEYEPLVEKNPSPYIDKVHVYKRQVCVLLCECVSVCLCKPLYKSKLNTLSHVIKMFYIRPPNIKLLRSFLVTN